MMTESAVGTTYDFRSGTGSRGVYPHADRYLWCISASSAADVADEVSWGQTDRQIGYSALGHGFRAGLGDGISSLFALFYCVDLRMLHSSAAEFPLL